MWKNRLKQEWNENPLQVIAVVAIAISSVSRLLNAVSSTQGRRAYARQVNYRIKK